MQFYRYLLFASSVFWVQNDTFQKLYPDVQIILRYRILVTYKIIQHSLGNFQD